MYKNNTCDPQELNEILVYVYDWLDGTDLPNVKIIFLFKMK